MERSTIGGIINWSACGVAQSAPVYGMPIVYAVTCMFIIGAYLMAAGPKRETKRKGLPTA